MEEFQVFNLGISIKFFWNIPDPVIPQGDEQKRIYLTHKRTCKGIDNVYTHEAQCCVQKQSSMPLLAVAPRVS